MATFDCTYEQLKHMAVDYLKALPTLDADGAENALKCFNLHYLGCQYEHPSEQVLAVSLVKYVGKKYLDRDIQLCLAK